MVPRGVSKIMLGFLDCYDKWFIVQHLNPADHPTLPHTDPEYQINSSAHLSWMKIRRAVNDMLPN